MTDSIPIKHTALTEALAQYMTAHRSGAVDPLLAELRVATAQLGDDAVMQIGDVQGSLLTILTRLINANSALEIGTFTGHSSICIARGLPDDGRLICLDMSKDWTDVAREFWHKAGVADKIDLRLGDAIESLRNLLPSDIFDLIHIDAEKTQYDQYFELALPHLRTNGLIIFDNMLWEGLVVEPDPDERTFAVQQMNHKLANDPRVETVLLSIGDGIQFCRKR